MLINTSNYQSVQVLDFFFLQLDGHVIITKDISHNYLFEKEVLFQCYLGKELKQKDLFKALAAKSDLPKELLQLSIDRSRDLVGETMLLFTDQEKSIRFCDNEKWASFCGIENPCQKKLTVVEIFDNNNDFTNAFTDNSDEAFGFWDVLKNEISSTFIWGHPLQTQICFGDFAKHHLKFGSLFLKMKIEDI